MKSTVEDKEKLGGKLDEDQKHTIKEAVKDGEEWLSANPEADADEIKEKQKEIEEKCNPIIQQLYQNAGGGKGGEPAEDVQHDEL